MEDFVALVKEILDDVKDKDIKKMLELKIEDYKTVFCNVIWKEVDIADAIRDRLSIDATDNNVSDVRDMISIGAMEDHMVEEGWYSINDAVDRWDEENNNEENGGM